MYFHCNATISIIGLKNLLNPFFSRYVRGSASIALDLALQRRRVTNTSPFNEIVLFLNPNNNEQDGHNNMTKIYSLLGEFNRESIV